MRASDYINEAFRLISAIPVSGESVEIMAQAREYLRKAYKEVTENGDPDPEGNH